VLKSNLLKDDYAALLLNKKDNLRFNEKVVQLIIFALIRLITKKPKDPDMKGRTNAAREKLKLLTYPEDYKAEERIPKAIFKIKEPKVIEGEENPNAENTENEKKSAKSKAAEPEEVKIQCVNPYGASTSVLVYHEYAAKKIRDDILDSVMALFQTDIEGVDRDELVNRSDQRMLDEEKALVKELKIPLFEIE
jgi:hypothetical protein